MAAGTYTSRATAKFWVMPRTGTAILPVDSAATGVTATKGFDLARDLIGGLPELEDQIGGAMVGTSGQKRSERVATAVRDLQPFDLSFRDNRAPHAASPAQWSGQGRCSSAPSSTPARRTPPRGAWSWNTRMVTRRPSTCSSATARRCRPWGLEGDDAITGISLTFMPTGVVTYT